MSEEMLQLTERVKALAVQCRQLEQIKTTLSTNNGFLSKRLGFVYDDAKDVQFNFLTFCEHIINVLDNGECKPKCLQVQEGGSHYSKLEIQPIEYIYANKIGYFEGNAIKYITRHNDKNGALDIKKAIHYLQMILELQYKE